MSVNELQALTQQFADAFDQSRPQACHGDAFWVNADSPSDARRSVQDMIPDAVVTGVNRIRRWSLSRLLPEKERSRTNRKFCNACKLELIRLFSRELDFPLAGRKFGTMRKDAELQRLVETLSQHLGEQIRKEQENPELEKHLISVALIPLIEKAIRVGLTESEFHDECREIWDIQAHPEKYST